MLAHLFRRSAFCITTQSPAQQSTQWFSISAVARAKALPPRKKIDENEIEESFLKGSGPGGQKINKTASAVQLKHIPTGIVVKSQHTRSRDQNRKYARQILAEKLEEMELGDKSRTAIKAAIMAKKKASKTKKARRKYKKQDEDKSGAAWAESGAEEEDRDE